MDQAPPNVYDVFLSCSGDDRPRVRELRDALTKVGLQVFLDERNIRFAHSITGDIQEALRRSKTILLYYSASFPSRPACQFELHHAYLSALPAGEVEWRILVVNPEDPATGHLMPLEAWAHRYWPTWSSKSELAKLVDQVRQAVRRVDAPFPGIDFTSAPRRTKPLPVSRPPRSSVGTATGGRFTPRCTAASTR